MTTEQKDRLAQAITALHSVTFCTPTLYVNARLHQIEAPGDYYLAGKPMLPHSPKCIFGLVRTSPLRSREYFDMLAT